MKIKLLDVLTSNFSDYVSSQNNKEVKISAVQVLTCLSSKFSIERALKIINSM